MLAAIAVMITAVVVLYTRERTHTQHARDTIAELRHRAPGTIDGHVTGTGHATVCARAGESAPKCTTSDGAFALEVEPGAYVVWASAPGLRGGRVAVDVGEGARVSIELPLSADGAHVTGVVRDVRGRPIPGALVHVATTFTATTGSDGAFDAWVAPGDIHAIASAPGFVDGEASGVAPGELAFSLTPESGVAGTVVDATTKAPVVDADVDAGGEHARTDAAGHFRIPKLRPGRYKPTATAIGAYGEAAESVLVTLGSWAEGIVIEVHPVAVVAGHVVTPSGPCPPDRGSVRLTRFDDAAIYWAKTLVDGTIVVEGVVPGTYQVDAQCDGYLSRVPYPDIAVGDSDVEDLEWSVLAGARVTGKVTAKATGAPIAHAVVNHIGGGGTSIVSVQTGADGTFIADGVAPGTNELAVLADGFTRAQTSVVAALTSAVHVDVALDAGGSITGELVDDTGAPIDNGEIQVSGPDLRSTRADATGTFTLDDLDPGSYEIEADFGWGAGGKGTIKADVAMGQATHVRVVAERDHGSITGSVIDEHGKPISDAFVAIAREDDDGDARMWHGVGEDILPDAAGAFAYEHLPPGHFRLRAYRAGGGQVFADHVALGDRVTLSIRPTGSIAGIVTGDGIDDVTIHCEDRKTEISRDERAFHTGGRFTLNDLPAGTYKVWVGDDSRQAAVVQLGDGEHKTGVALVAHRRYSIRGRLVDKAGAPVVNWKVSVPYVTSEEEMSGGRKVTTYSEEMSITGGDGRFLIRNLPAGPAEVAAAPVDADGDPPPLRAVVLASDPDVDLGDVTP